MPRQEPTPEPEMVYHALDRKKEKDVLAKFTPEQQAEIKQKQQTLSSLAYFIGKDFRIPVELNQPGAGWHWDFQENVIRIDPKDLLEKPMDYLRFVISHEGGHRRISRADFIPLEEWRQPGFSFMMNAIEDPRDNNFVAESYPKFREQMGLAYKEDLDFEAKAKEKADQKLGVRPRFMQAGFEYIKQWFREVEGKDFELSENLPEDVKAAVAATLESARDSWWRYPSRQEADKGGKIGRKKVDGETMIKQYAKTSYEINRDEVWPEFKKLVDADMEDQKMQELLKDMQKGQEQREGGEGGHNLPQELKDKLTPEEQQTLQEAVKQAIEDAEKEKSEAQGKEPIEGEAEKTPEPSERSISGKPIDLKTLPEELKQKIKEFIESLPEEQQKEMTEKAQTAFKEFEDALNEELQGKMSEDPEKKAQREELEREQKEKDGNRQSQGGDPVRTGTLPKEPVDTENLRIYRERLQREINKDENTYEQYRREVLPLIDELEADLRQILIDRSVTKWRGGFKSGKRIDIKKRLQEKGQHIPAMESKAWQKRERPNEKDYAISLLIDLSGSMREKIGGDRKIDETFKSVIVLAEALNRLGINLEVVGFNDDLYEYQNFGQLMSKQIREHMGGMFKEVEDSCCKNCGNEHSETDLGWATKIAAERLAAQKSAKKMIIVLTDGKMAESSKHPRQQFDHEKIKDEMLKQTDIVPIDIGSIAGKTVNQIIDELKKLLEKNV